MLLAKIGFALIAVAPLALPDEPQKPACDKSTAGQFWPPEANQDHQALARLARCGELEMCVRNVWRHHWEKLTVRADQLGKSRPSSTCSADIDSPAKTKPSTTGTDTHIR